MSYLEEFWDKRRAQKNLTPEQKEKVEKKRAEEQRQKIIAFKKYFGTEEGQAVMIDLMNRFYILQPLPETNDAMEMARAEGKRDVVLYLLAEAKTDMDKLDKILKGDFNG